MDKIQIFEKLNENMQNLENVENEISMLQLAIYQKNIEKLKDYKMNEMREFFEQQSRFYNQKSAKYEYEIEKNINKKYSRTNLLGGNQEVLIFKSINYNTIELETFIKVETIYDNIFKEFVNRNVFGWISKQEYNQIITKSTQWFDIKDLKKHEDIPYVVYYLIDDINKEIYIGSATRLGDRVKPGRHEIPGWNKFRYEIIHPKYHKELKTIEYHSIMNFARFFNNNGNLRTLGISDYNLVNKDYKFYQK